MSVFGRPCMHAVESVALKRTTTTHKRGGRTGGVRAKIKGFVLRAHEPTLGHTGREEEGREGYICICIYYIYTESYGAWWKRRKKIVEIDNLLQPVGTIDQVPLFSGKEPEEARGGKVK